MGAVCVLRALVAAVAGAWTNTYPPNPARFTVAGQSITDNSFAVTYTVTAFGTRGSGNIVLNGTTGAGASNPDGFYVLYANGTWGNFSPNSAASPRVFSMAPSGGSPGIGLVGGFGGNPGGSANQPSYVLPV